MKKLSFLVHLITAIIIYPSTTQAANVQEASAAFQALVTTGEDAINNLNQDADISRQVKTQIDLEKSKLNLEILEVLNGVRSKIELERGNARLDVSSCTEAALKEVDELEGNLLVELERCSNATTVHALAAIQWQNDNAYVLYKNVLTCESRSLSYCKLHDESDICYGVVIDQFHKATSSLVNFIGLIKVNILNGIVGMKMPCTDLIKSNVQVYPTFVLDYVTNCIKNRVSDEINLICVQ